MNKINLNIDKRQLVILAIVVVMFMFVIAYWQFLYLPKSREVAIVRGRVTDFDVNIKEEEAKVKAAGYEQEIAKVQEEVKRLQDKFPSQNQLPSLFKELFNQANKFNIEIISLEPGKTEIFKPQGPSDASLIFNKVPIRLKLKAGYRALSEFLKALFENAQYAFSFDELKIDKPNDQNSKLDVDLLLGAFVLSYEGAAPIEQDLQKGLEFNLRGKK
jgi:Tfp pilus assembly protein PilO